MKTKKFLSILLSLVLVLGIIPGMSLTAFADGNTTTITPGTDAAKTGTGTMTITLIIKDPAATDFDVTLPTSLAYDGTAKTASAAAKSTVTGMGAITVEYYKNGTKVDSAVEIGDYTVKLNVAAGTHYSAGAVENADWKFTITKGAAAVTKAPTAKTLTYTGSAQELVTSGEATGGTMQYALGTATEATEPYTTSIPTATDAGTYRVYYKVEGDDNYNDSDVDYVDVTIAQKALTITAGSDTKVYDGTELTKNSYTATALATGDVLASVTVTGTQTEAGSSANVASGAVIKKGDVDVTSNYEITYTDGTLTVTQATTNTVTVSIEGWTYGDTAKTPTSTATWGTASYTYSATLNGTYSETVPSTAGTWYVKANVAETTNYVGGSATTSFVISPKALTITADSDTKVYDGTELTKNSYTATALATGDALASVTVTGTQTEAGSSANVASAAVIKKGDVDVTSNYEITYTDGTLTVTQATTNTVTVAIEGWTYGDTAKTPTSTATWGTTSYTYSATLNGTYSETVPSTAGTWYVKANVAETTNYVGGSATTSFVISPKALTITADSDTKVYDGTELTKNSYTATDLVTGDALVSVTITGTQTDAGESANVASAAVIKKGDVDVTSNYEITYTDGTLTVTKADSTVSTDPEALELTYTGEEQELVKAGQSEGGSLVYALATDDAEPAATAYIAEIPKAMANGTYHIWYKAAADANYNETVAKSVDATISPVDKTELEDEITLAKRVVDEIKDDAPDAAEELTKAIAKAEEVAKDDEALKATVDAEIEALVNAIVDAIEAVPDRFSYVNTSGAGSVWNKTMSGLTFRFERTVNEKATFAHFVGIRVDGAEVDAKFYDAKIGSVIITLKPEYLETLAAGEHTLTVMFDDGDDVTVKFTIEEPLTPATGDENDMELWFILMAAAFVTAAMTKKKRRA